MLSMVTVALAIYMPPSVALISPVYSTNLKYVELVSFMRQTVFSEPFQIT